MIISCSDHLERSCLSKIDVPSKYSKSIQMILFLYIIKPVSEYKYPKLYLYKLNNYNFNKTIYNKIVSHILYNCIVFWLRFFTSMV